MKDEHGERWGWDGVDDDHISGDCLVHIALTKYFHYLSSGPSIVRFPSCRWVAAACSSSCQ